MVKVIQAIDAGAGVTTRGFTFIGAKGPKEDLYLSFEDLRLEIIRRAQHLRSLGLVKGDRVAMVLPDGQDFVPTFLAALWAGVIPVPLYPPVSLGKLDNFMEAMVSILGVARPRVLVTTERVGKVLWSAVGRVASLEKVVDAATLRLPAPEGQSEAPADLDDGDTAFLQFTSGSTALPKGVNVTHGNLAANCEALLYQGLDLSTKDVAVSWLPLYHDMGLIGFVLTPLIGSISTFYIPTLSFIKNATVWPDTLHKYKGTVSFAPNFAFALVTRRAKPEQIARWDLSHVRSLGCGAEPINPGTLRAFLAALAPAGLRPDVLVPSYGMAEATLGIALAPLRQTLCTERIDADRYHADRKAAPVAEGAPAESSLEMVSCGRTFRGHELSIQDEDGRLLPERSVGEICFRGPSVAHGYFNDPEASRKAGMATPGGWLRTGDLGYLVDGQVFISGRIKDILIVNGRNYYPQTIEWVVDEMDGVRRGSAVVFSRPGASSEEVVVAAEGRAPDLAVLRAAIAARVSEETQLAVAEVVVVPPGSLPKTSSGKIQRRKTRELYLAGRLGTTGVQRGAAGMGNRLLAARVFAAAWMGRARHEARGLMKRFLSQ